MSLPRHHDPTLETSRVVEYEGHDIRLRILSLGGSEPTYRAIYEIRRIGDDVKERIGDAPGTFFNTEEAEKAAFQAARQSILASPLEQPSSGWRWSRSRGYQWKEISGWDMTGGNVPALAFLLLMTAIALLTPRNLLSSVILLDNFVVVCQQVFPVIDRVGAEAPEPEVVRFVLSVAYALLPVQIAVLYPRIKPNIDPLRAHRGYALFALAGSIIVGILCLTPHDLIWPFIMFFWFAEESFFYLGLLTGAFFHTFAMLVVVGIRLVVNFNKVFFPIGWERRQ